jgi:hypothetical protein
VEDSANDALRLPICLLVLIALRLFLEVAEVNDGMSGMGLTTALLPDCAAASELGPTTVPDSIAIVVAKVERGVKEEGVEEMDCELPGGTILMRKVSDEESKEFKKDEPQGLPVPRGT